MVCTSQKITFTKFILMKYIYNCIVHEVIIGQECLNPTKVKSIFEKIAFKNLSSSVRPKRQKLEKFI